MHWRTALRMGADAAAWTVALPLAALLRYDFAGSAVDLGAVVAGVLAAVVGQYVLGVVAGLYTGRWRTASFDEVTALGAVAAATTSVLFALNASLEPQLVPRSAVLGGGFVALVGQCAARWAWRLRDQARRRPPAEGRTRLLVFGAGEGGAQAVTAMLRDPDSPWYPVGLLDDDPHKARRSIMGVRVVGESSHVGDAARATGAESLLVAIPSASSALIRRVAEQAHEVGLAVRVLPPVAELLGSAVGLGDFRPVTERDLLGRHEVDTDLRQIASYLTGKRVLVTGAGGSIGSELCRQLLRFSPASLVMLDRDESALHSVQLSIEGRALLDSDELVVADVRDRERLAAIFGRHRPEVVFHAAALKHLPLCERHPTEAVKTNVWGTRNLLAVAAEHGVERFVNISTDKAADPTSVLGYTKRVAERLCAWQGTHQPGAWLSVRFGNVLGSRGSVLSAFRQQIARGGPVTVTAPEVTRYFMTVEEAVQLVVQAGAIGSDGEALVLDMGEPVRIADLAQRLVAEAEQPIEIVFTGLRPGEKLHEVLLGADEHDRRPVHPLISHVDVPPLAVDELGELASARGDTEALAALRAACHRATADRRLAVGE